MSQRDFLPLIGDAHEYRPHPVYSEDGLVIEASLKYFSHEEMAQSGSNASDGRCLGLKVGRTLLALFV